MRFRLYRLLQAEVEEATNFLLDVDRDDVSCGHGATTANAPAVESDAIMAVVKKRISYMM
jgi:hypothetical protein